MSLTITISDVDAEYFERHAGNTLQPRSSGVGMAILDARESLKRGEAKITLSKECSEFWFRGPTRAGSLGGEVGASVREFRTVSPPISTPYELWREGLLPDVLLAWEAMQNTYAALKLARLGCSQKHLRKMASEEFGEECLEGLPL